MTLLEIPAHNLHPPVLPPNLVVEEEEVEEVEVVEAEVAEVEVIVEVEVALEYVPLQF